MGVSVFGSGLLVVVLGVLAANSGAASQDAPRHAVAESVRVTILSSNLANGATVGEWGFSAFAQVDDRCVLFDAGRYPDTVLRNAEVLGVDLSCVTDIVLSHFHFDHTTGLMPLLDDLRGKSPDALRRIHVAEGFFLSRRVPAQSGDAERNQMIEIREVLRAQDVEVVEHSQPAEILSGVWVTGPIVRTHAEKNYPASIRVKLDGDWVEDYVPDSQGLAILTDKGPIVLLGCGHSGAVNLLEQVQREIQNLPIHALMGGMHLFSADEQTLAWTADRLRDLRVEHLMAGHCTGIEPLMRLRVGLNLNRRTAVVGAVGSKFVYGEGIHPTAIAQ